MNLVKKIGLMAMLLCVCSAQCMGGDWAHRATVYTGTAPATSSGSIPSFGGVLTVSNFLEFVKTNPKVSMVAVPIVVLGAIYYIRMAVLACLVKTNDVFRSDSRANRQMLSEAKDMYYQFKQNVFDDLEIKFKEMKATLLGRVITNINNEIRRKIFENNVLKNKMIESWTAINNAIERTFGDPPRFKGIKDYPKDILVTYEDFTTDDRVVGEKQVRAKKKIPSSWWRMWSDMISVQDDFIWHWVLDPKKYEAEIDSAIDATLGSVSDVLMATGTPSGEFATQPYAASIAKIYMRLFLARKLMAYILFNIYDHDVQQQPEQVAAADAR